MKTVRMRFWLLIVIAGVGFLLLYPYETTVVPAWRVKVVDEEGKPITKVTVSEYWRHTSIESESHEAESTTDDEGYVAFPRRIIRASLIKRVAGPIINVLRFGAHADFGPHAYLIVSGDMNSTTDNSDYLPGKSLPEQIIRRRIK